VDSFLSQPAIEQREKENRISESPKPVEGLHRRNVLACLAGLPIAVTGLSPAAVDPIYAAIEAFRRAHALFFAEYVGDIPDEIGDQYSAACSVMQRTRPTTPAGLAVLTAWAREQADWLCANSSDLNSEDYCALTASIDDATRGMSGLKPWSPPLPAVATPANSTPPSPDFEIDHKAILARAEQIVDLLRTCYVREGWKIDEAAADRALAYFRRHVEGPPFENEDQDTIEFHEGAVEFVGSHGQSLDWVLCGDPGSMICRLASRSKRAGQVQS
jgi:hypothetical protein